MRLRHIVIAAAAGTALVCAGTAAGEDAGKPVRCAITLQTLAAPTDLKVDEYGSVRCDSVFGKGVQHDLAMITPTSKTSGSVAGRFKQYFDKGTVRGTFALTFGPDATGAVKFTGTARIASGTGAYARTRGTAAIACEPRDPATHLMQCTETARLSAR